MVQADVGNIDLHLFPLTALIIVIKFLFNLEEAPFNFFLDLWFELLFYVVSF